LGAARSTAKAESAEEIVRNADDIRAEIQRITPEWARGCAMFGTAGVNGLTMWDAHRKCVLSVIEVEARAAAEQGGKYTDKAIEAAVHAQPSYQSFVKNGLKDKEAFVELSARRELLMGELKVAEARESFGCVEV
jgi:hypothetical protein